MHSLPCDNNEEGKLPKSWKSRSRASACPQEPVGAPDAHAAARAHVQSSDVLVAAVVVAVAFGLFTRHRTVKHNTLAAQAALLLLASDCHHCSTVGLVA